MDTKLTLKLQQSVIERAKEYAKKHKTSLSRLIENYLLNITDEENDEDEKITPLVKSLSGIIDLYDDSENKKAYTEYLANKYN